MLFPVSAFDEDDREDGLPPLPGPRIPSRAANCYDNDNNDRDGGGLSRSRPLSWISRYNEVAFDGANGHEVMNLKDLDAYVRETVRAHRQQRRNQVVTKVAILVAFVVIATAMLGSSIFVYEDVKESSPWHKMNTPLGVQEKNYHFTLPDDYIVTQCESAMTTNTSFLELIEDTEWLGDKPSCRPEVPECKWLNPTIPSPRIDENTVIMAEWNAAFRFNIRHMQGILESTPSDLDIILVGDSIVEHWEGKDMGISEPSLRRDHEVFEALFSRHAGGKLDGMAHGIAGDRCANLLYRLENGEMPKKIHSKVWWIVIGTEDWFQGIDSNSIVAGIAKIVQSIREVHPYSHIVVNSILPRGNEQRDGNPHYHSLYDINQKLNCFVQSENSRRNPDLETPKLSFFNATEIFLFRDPEVGYFVNPALLPDYINPSPQGEEIWGQQIVTTVLRLTAQDKDEDKNE